MLAHVHPHISLPTLGYETTPWLDEMESPLTMMVQHLQSASNETQHSKKVCVKYHVFYPNKKKESIISHHEPSWAPKLGVRLQSRRRMLSIWKMMLINLIKYRIFKYLENHMLHDTFVLRQHDANDNSTKYLLDTPPHVCTTESRVKWSGTRLLRVE